MSWACAISYPSSLGEDDDADAPKARWCPCNRSRFRTRGIHRLRCPAVSEHRKPWLNPTSNARWTDSVQANRMLSPIRVGWLPGRALVDPQLWHRLMQCTTNTHTQTILVELGKHLQALPRCTISSGRSIFRSPPQRHTQQPSWQRRGVVLPGCGCVYVGS